MNYQLDIDGPIGDYAYSKRYVKQKLSENKGKDVSCRMNSLGGALDHGLDMAAQFADHGKVTVYMFGFNASAATIASLGASKVCISEYGFYLAHKVSNWVDAWGYMNADEIAEVIKDLEANKKENDKMDLVLAEMYAKKSKRKCNEIMDILKEGRWLTANEALEYGFVDEIISEGTKVNFTSSLRDKFNAFGLPTPDFENHSDEQGSLMNIIKKGFSDLISKWDKENKETVQIMKKDNFKKVNAVLKLDNLDFADGKVTFTEEQIKNMEDRLAELEKSESDKQTLIDQQIEQIKNLKNAPGDDTTQHHDEDTGDDKNNDFLSQAKELFEKV